MKIKPIGSNMTELHVGDVVVLFSYQAPVAALTDDGYIRTTQHYSATTTKHINKWLDGAAAETVDQSILDKLAKG